MLQLKRNAPNPKASGPCKLPVCATCANQTGQNALEREEEEPQRRAHHAAYKTDLTCGPVHHRSDRLWHLAVKKHWRARQPAALDCHSVPHWRGEGKPLQSEAGSPGGAR